jgi:hypothetical protein
VVSSAPAQNILDNDTLVAFLGLYFLHSLLPQSFLNGLGVSFFGLYPQLCENGGVCGSQILYCILHHDFFIFYLLSSVLGQATNHQTRH